MKPLSLLCEIIAQGGRASAAFYHDNLFFEALLRYGYLRESGVVASVVCSECDTGHSAPVVVENGRYGYYCPDLGFSPLDRACLRAVLPDLPRLIERLSEALDCKRRKASTIYGQTRRIGAVEADGHAITLYFHPRLQGEDDARDLDRALSLEVRSPWRLIVTAIGTLRLEAAEAVRLDDLAELDVETGVLRILAQPADLLGIPCKNKGGRPSDYGPILATIISSRIQSGEALVGINAEAKAIRAEFKAGYPDIPVPSLSTVKRHLLKSQGGS
ncbi:hypothetical protein [Pseudooceanicola sp.]|uniref:hypothetical protein n=1 Tax=Pseudooceanicola sp. TaxID=1914328 RepID=UPI00260F5FDB|nr:hypothetical protein [Pseudooceanicola sp.]MDF1856498.1 hypothetical protein [Pseudooceanicola sp.]